MPEQNDLLDKFKLPPEQKNKHYLLLLYISAFYVLLVIISSIINFSNISFSHETSDWIFLIIIILPALSGFFTSLGGSYIGWFISLLYYISIMVFTVTLVAKDLIKGWVPISYYFTEAHRVLPLLLLPPLIIALLLSKSIRIYMEVSALLFRVGLCISLAFGIVLAYLAAAA